MRFAVDHVFPAPPSAVAALLVDPGFQGELELPDLSRAEVLGREERDGAVVLRLRYEFVGSLDAWARRLLGARRLAWLQELRVEPESGAGSVTFSSEADPDRLHGMARFSLSEEAGRTRRHLEGELVVSLPALGGLAERRIVPGLVRRLEIEAEALSARLDPSPADGPEGA